MAFFLPALVAKFSIPSSTLPPPSNPLDCQARDTETPSPVEKASCHSASLQPSQPWAPVLEFLVSSQSSGLNNLFTIVTN
ncbi:hypothetical protein BO86DRAFT_234544 [Aspergillus japonicus CBS 114.51]|uniref:Uncharacterized protein n=1 Tax=Aspergillus japonicus CBS 114.51 TaxID=1448312 RepID=A0A8T8WN30_ASPJA|nr:hypothetical protein BO86DRAFT_234544 [Aspergillus japonicus CBS 114.51]RAH77032.1 hypothetical protein BO86DRAFT_234544 [Aspergillus japonicus CBS 114.51]